MIVWRSGLAAFFLLCSALLAEPVAAQPSGAKGDDFIYKVRSGDTLGELSTRYTLSRENWTTLQTLNQVSQDTQLPIAKQLRIPFSLIPEVPASATVTHISGEVLLNGRQAVLGDTLDEGQALRTRSGAYVTLSLPDGSVLSVPASSSLRFSRLRTFQGAGLVDAIIDIEEGGLDSEVAPENTGVGRFEIRSPVSITGVRGTRLRVSTQDQGSRTELIQGQAEVEGQRSGDVALGTAQGVAVDAAGDMSGVQKLLPAPQLGTPRRGSSGWEMDVEPLAGAQTYLVSVAADPEGTRVISQARVSSSPVRFGASAPGTWYVLVRGLDSYGLGGLDAYQTFEGAAVLTASDGQAIMTSYGDFVGLGHNETVAPSIITSAS